MGTTGGLGGPNPGLGAAVAGSMDAMTGPEDELEDTNPGRADDGAAVGAADSDADARRSGADTEDSTGDTGFVMEDDPGASNYQATEGGETIGLADRDADIDRTT